MSQQTAGNDAEVPPSSSASLLSSSVVKAGLLTKRGGLRKSWKIRYFVFYSDGLMYYFDTYESFCTNNNKAIKGMITIKGGSLLVEGDADFDPKWYAGKKNVFGIKCGSTSRVYVVSAENNEEKESWIRTIAAYLGITIDHQQLSTPSSDVSSSSPIIDQPKDSIPPLSPNTPASPSNASSSSTSSVVGNKDKRCNFPSCDKTFTLLRKGVGCYDCKLVYCAPHCNNGIDLPIPHGHQLICDACKQKRKDEEEKEKQDLLNAFIQSGDNGGGRQTIVTPPTSSIASFNQPLPAGSSIAFSTPSDHRDNPQQSIPLKASHTQNNSLIYKETDNVIDSSSKEAPREYYAAPPSLHPYEIADDESDEYMQLQDAETSSKKEEKKKSSCQCCIIQ